MKANPRTTVAGAAAGVFTACGLVWPKYAPIFGALATLAVAVGLAWAADAKSAGSTGSNSHSTHSLHSTRGRGK